MLINVLLQILDVDKKIESLSEKQMDGSWLCRECGYVSRWKTNLKMHVESRHLVTAGVTCHICQQFCSNRKALRNHTNRYHRDKGYTDSPQ